MIIKQAFALLVIHLILSGFSAHAGKLDLLLMPGDLITGHAEFEEECEKCHETLKKQNQALRCLACHDHADIAKDIKNKTGFHGRLDPDQAKVCRHCHTDHKGREKNVIIFDSESFDHRLTDLELKGAHKSVDCVSCHTRELKKFSQAPSVCFDCHKSDDSHRGKLGEECEKCHNEEEWKRQTFEHNKDTEYKLVGRHEELACKLCHAGEHYKNTPKDCYSCHLINDVHNGHYADKCEKCHTSYDWKKLNFNHDKDTEYPLAGRHKETKCDACHSKGPYKEKPDKSCNSCHKKDDEHKGRNGTDCKECHSSKGWKKVEFDHSKDTKFPIKGKHLDLVCTACHRSTSMDKIKESGCVDCHRANDVHNGEQGDNCADCHNESGWNEKVFFDHDLSRFPLIGMHGITSCEACHLTAEYRNTESTCFGCHKSEDAHDGRFSEHCGGCHNPNGWMLWYFEHDTQTEYPLEGVHRELHCNTCHRTSLEKHTKLSTQCYGCHRGDDIHRGSFGRHCDRCHNVESFENAIIK